MRPALEVWLAHLAEHERAVGAAQRAHPETVEHVLVGKAPVAPGQEAGKIGLEIARLRCPPANTGWRPIRTRPFHNCGLSRCASAKCATISARRASANGHDQASTGRSSEVTR